MCQLQFHVRGASWLMVLLPARVESRSPVRKGMGARGLINDGGCDPGYAGVQLRRIRQEGCHVQASQTKKARERDRCTAHRAFRGLAQLSAATSQHAPGYQPYLCPMRAPSGSATPMARRCARWCLHRRPP